MTESVEAAFWQGIDQFNQGEFYACHDTLEALWMEAIEPDKTFYQGILQIAVALYHLGNQNLKGAMILLGEGMNRLRRYQPDYAEINVEQLIQESTRLLTTLQQLSTAQTEAIAQSMTGDRWLSEEISFPIIQKLEMDRRIDTELDT
jgi:uncharacterized protein